jgi:HEAT repeats/Tetratricopeptide repeat
MRMRLLALGLFAWTLSAQLLAPAPPEPPEPPEPPQVPAPPAPNPVPMPMPRMKIDTRGRGGSEESIYRRGGRLLEERKWDEAATEYQKLISEKGARTEAALYWKAYALNKLGRKQESLAALDQLAKEYPSSRWLNDAKALEVEVRRSSGQPVSPEAETDEELKLLAVSALMESDPERAIPVAEGLLQKGSSPRLKERALFVLAHADTPRARETVIKVAKGAGNPDLQLRAVEYLGMTRRKEKEAQENRPILAEIYASTSDVNVKRAVLRAYLMSGDKERLMAAYKSEQNLELRREAIRGLGGMNPGDELWQIYQSETNVELKREILRVAPAKTPEKLVEIARNEKDENLKREAIYKIGSMRNNTQAGDALVSLYSASSPESRKDILNAFQMQNNAKSLIEVARKETDPNLKKRAGCPWQA